MSLTASEAYELYATEGFEMLELAEESVLALEDGQGVDDLNALYRAMHTLKGNSRVVGFDSAERLAHRAEDVVALVRDYGLPPTPAWATLILTSLDTIRAVITASVEQRADTTVPAMDATFTALDAFLAEHEDLVPEKEEAMDAPGDIFLFDDEGEARHILDPNFWSEAPPASEPVPSAPAAEEKADEEPPAPERNEPAPAPPTAGSDAPKSATKAKAVPTFRVSATKIDQVMSLAGELHLALGAVFDHPALTDLDADDFHVQTHRVEKIVQELQDAAAGLGLTPVVGVFTRAKRVVRDLAIETGKPLQLVIDDRGAEVDRALVDRLYDPLVHLIRNAADHGIEPPETRERVGKPPEGTLTLSARQDGGQIVIQIRDDGGGLDRDRILRRAIERGLLPRDARPSDREIDQLIFAPGFSTAERVSNLSGRGVGMDVVLSTIRELGGRAEVTSYAGEGTQVELRVPLTMAFTEVLVVEVDGGYFGIPMSGVLAMVQPDPEENVVVTSSEGEVSLRIHGELLPLRWLDGLLGRPTTGLNPQQRLVVAIQTTGGRIAVPIPNLIGTESVTIKPLPEALRTIPAAAACGVLRSGRVVVILDGEQVAACGRAELSKAS